MEDTQNINEISVATTSEVQKGSKWKKYLKKLGVVGFLFFFIKGLVWIGVFALGAKGCTSLMD